MVTRLDRLARSTLDLLNIIKATAAKEANFLSLAEPWANTLTAIGKLMLTMLSGVAEFERDLIALRTSDGRERAKKAGVKFGAKPKSTCHQIEEVRQRKERGELCRSWPDPMACRQIRLAAFDSFQAASQEKD